MTPLIIGEVLFDEFPDGQSVLGGAPFNVAWNLQGLGEKPLFVSAVGNDQLGKLVRERMDSWELRTEGLQVEDGLPTGRVKVSENENGPAYEIMDRQAYDHIGRLATTEIDSTEISLIYHGSLAWRNQKTRETIVAYRREFNCPVFVDLNIREPWFDQSWLPELLKNVNWLKLNTDELAKVSGLSAANGSSIRTALDLLKERYGCGNFFVTDGENGAYGLNESGQFDFVATPKVNKVVDTVGAGDAFSAAAIRGLLNDKPQKLILQQAVEFAARICRIRGATISNAETYLG